MTAELVLRYGRWPSLDKTYTPFETLTASIIGRQSSVTAAARR